MSTHLRRSALLIAVIVTAAGCGSTVQPRGLTAPAGAQGDQGLGPGSASAGDQAGTGVTGVGAGPLGPGQQQGTAGSGVPGRTVTIAGGGGGAAPVTTKGSRRDAQGMLQGPGVTPTQIYVGATYFANADAALAAQGAGSITQGNTKGEFQALFNDINARGGVAGRKLVPVWHAYDAQSSDTGAGQDQAACADLTQDNKIFAVAGAGLSDTFSACMKKAGVLEVMSGDFLAADDTWLSTYPNYVDPGTLSQNRMMRALADSLLRRGYFNGWNTTTGQPAAGTKTKVGVLTIKDPRWQRPLSKVLLPALARGGNPVDSANVYEVPIGQDSSATIASIQAAALRFRNDGVTHVIFLDANGSLTGYFAKNAQSQGYYPRFGVNSAASMQVLVDGGLLDASQLRGALGLGWVPNQDLKAEYHKKYAGAGRARCLAVMEKAGYTFGDSNSRSIALAQCDQMYLITEAIRGAGPSITLPNALDAVARLRETFPAAGNAGMSFGANKRDGVRFVYDLTWDTDCNCAKYLDNGHAAP